MKVKSNKAAITITTTPPPVIKRTSSIRRYRSMLDVPKDSVALRDYLHDGTYFELRKALLSLPDSDKTHEVMVKKAKR